MQVVLLDEAGALKKLMPFVRCLNDYLVHRTKRESRKCTAYRISRMSTAQLATIKEGTTYRISMYVATSSRKRALRDIKTWQRDSGVESKAQWEFTIPKQCWQATRISKLSLHSTEHEMLIVPWSAVYIKEKKQDTATGVTTIVADVLVDAAEVPGNLPTIVA
jgi:hypothetical protein